MIFEHNQHDSNYIYMYVYTWHTGKYGCVSIVRRAIVWQLNSPTLLRWEKINTKYRLMLFESLCTGCFPMFPELIISIILFKYRYTMLTKNFELMCSKLYQFILSVTVNSCVPTDSCFIFFYTPHMLSLARSVVQWGLHLRISSISDPLMCISFHLSKNNDPKIAKMLLT